MGGRGRTDPPGYQGRQAFSSTVSSVTSAFTMVAGAEEGRGAGGEVGSPVRGDSEQRMEGPAVRLYLGVVDAVLKPARGDDGLELAAGWSEEVA